MDACCLFPTRSLALALNCRRHPRLLASSFPSPFRLVRSMREVRIQEVGLSCVRRFDGRFDELGLHSASFFLPCSFSVRYDLRCSRLSRCSDIAARSLIVGTVVKYREESSPSSNIALHHFPSHRRRVQSRISSSRKGEIKSWPPPTASGSTPATSANPCAAPRTTDRAARTRGAKAG